MALQARKVPGAFEKRSTDLTDKNSINTGDDTETHNQL